MFGLGVGEIVIILVLALILLGPTRLPDAAKQLGKSLREFKKATDDLKGQFEDELYSDQRSARPKLATPSPDAPAAVPHIVPPGGVPAAPAAPALAATADNVPGLEAALADQPAPAPAQAPAPAAAPPPAVAPEAAPQHAAAPGEKAP